MAKDDPRIQLRIARLQALKQASFLRRFFFELEKKIRHFVYLRSQPRSSLAFSFKRPKILFVTISFNQPELIDLQLQALKEFIREPYEVVVVDNSPDSDEQSSIQEVSERGGATYVLAPKNPYSWLDPSLSHALALDWTWSKVIESVKPEVAVFLDHDLFPISPVSIEQTLKNFDVVGQKKGTDGPWFLWPGLLLMRCSFFLKKHVSFMPRANTDSGGQLWWSVYRKMKPEQIGFLEVEKKKFKSGESPSWHGEVHLFSGSWLHLVDGSGWGDGEGKSQKLPINSLSIASLNSFLSKIPPV